MAPSKRGTGGSGCLVDGPANLGVQVGEILSCSPAGAVWPRKRVSQVVVTQIRSGELTRDGNGTSALPYALAPPIAVRRKELRASTN